MKLILQGVCKLSETCRDSINLGTYFEEMEVGRDVTTQYSGYNPSH